MRLRRLAGFPETEKAKPFREQELASGWLVTENSKSITYKLVKALGRQMSHTDNGCWPSSLEASRSLNLEETGLAEQIRSRLLLHVPWAFFQITFSLLMIMSCPLSSHTPLEI